MKTTTMHSADNIGDFCLQNEAYNRASKAKKASPSYTVMSLVFTLYVGLTGI